jgi:hypothetical protein
MTGAHVPAANTQFSKGFVMYARLFLALSLSLSLAFLAAIIVLSGHPFPHGSGAALADPTCSNGTNWDNILQVCR